MKNKLISIIVFLFVLPVNLFADDYAAEFPIYIYGDVTAMKTVYEFIKEAVAHDAVESLVELGIFITAMFAAYKIKDGDVSGFTKNIIAPLTVLTMFFIPTSTVHITDLRVDNGIISGADSPGGGYAMVEDVPLAIAFLPATVSLFVSTAIEIIDESWSAVHIANKFSATGFQGMSQIFQDSIALAKIGSSTDSNGTVNLSKDKHYILEYIDKCMLKEALKIAENAPLLYSPKERFPEMFNPANFSGNIGTKIVSVENWLNSGHTNYSCSILYTDFVEASETGILDEMKKIIKKKHPEVDPDSTSFAEGFRQYTGDNINKIGNLDKAMAMTVASSLIKKQESINAIGTDSASIAEETTILRSLANLRAEGPAKFAWLSRTVPDVIDIVLAIVLACFPFVVIVASFMGSAGFDNIRNYFMGYFALSFNLVGLALVQNVISFYTEQEALAFITNMAGLPYGLSNVDDFVLHQADMAGLAGMIGAASIFAVTPLIFTGSTQAFNSAIGSVGGAFSGNISESSRKAMADADRESAADQKYMEDSLAWTEEKAQSWLDEKGYTEFMRPGVSALSTYSEIMKGRGADAAGLAAKAFHQDNADEKLREYQRGNELLNTQSMMKTAGMGSKIDSISNAGDVSFQDGEVMAESVNATDEFRNGRGDERELNSNYDTSAIGTGMAASQFTKDMGMQFTGEKIEADNARYDESLAAINDFAKSQQDDNLKQGVKISNDSEEKLKDVSREAEKQKEEAIKANESQLPITLSNIDNEEYNAKLNENRSYTESSNNIASKLEQLDKDFGKGSQSHENSIFTGDGNISMLSDPTKLDDYQAKKSALEDEISNLEASHSSKMDEISRKADFKRDEANSNLDNTLSRIDEEKDKKEDAVEDEKRSKLAENSAASRGIESQRLSNIEDLKSESDTLSALTANAVNQSVQQIASGDGLLKSGVFDSNGFAKPSTPLHDYMKGIEAQALQKTKQTEGFGNKADLNSVIETALEDGQIQGSTVNKTNELRNSLNLTDTQGNKVNWNTDDIADGTALGNVSKEVSSIGTKMAVNEIDGEKNYMDGALHSSQKGANEMIGTGEFRQSVIDKDQTHKDKDGKEQITTIDDLMSASKTSVKSKLDSEFEDAQTLKDNFGTELNKNINYNNQHIIDDANAQNNKVKKEMESISNDPSMQISNIKDGSTSPSKEAKDKLQELSKQLIDVPDLQESTISHSDMVSNESKAKLSSRAGNAIGYHELGTDAFDTIATNTEYGTLSQAKTTAAKIATQGGVESAVKADVVESTIKAATQIDVLDKNLKQTGEAKDGLATPLKDLTSAIDKLASKDGTMASAKTAKELETLNMGHDEYVTSQRRAGINDAGTLTNQNAFADGAAPKKMGEKFNNTLQETLATMKPGDQKDHLSKVDKSLRDSGMGHVDKDGQAHFTAKGDDFVRAKAKLSANNTGLKDEMVIGDFAVSSNLTKDADGTMKITGGDNATINDMVKVDKGKSVNLHSFDAKTETQAKTEELVNLLTSPDKMVEKFAGWTSGQISEGLQGMGATKEFANEYSDSIALATGATMMAPIVNSMSSKLPGMGGETVRQKFKNSTESFTEKFWGIPSETTNNSTNNSTNSQYDNTSDNHSKHNNSSNNMPNYTTEVKDKQVKPKTISEQIDNQTKFEKAKVEMDNKHLQEKLLNPTANGVTERHAIEQHNLREKYHQSNPNVASAPKNSTWASRLTETFNGPGSWKAKVGVAAATTLGMASETFGSTIEAATNIASGAGAVVIPTNMGNGDIPQPGTSAYKQFTADQKYALNSTPLTGFSSYSVQQQSQQATQNFNMQQLMMNNNVTADKQGEDMSYSTDVLEEIRDMLNGNS